MNQSHLALVAAVAALTAACQSNPSIDVDQALDARSLELTLDAEGAPQEIEYHIDPGKVPAAVQAAMDELHPGGPYTDAEVESHGGETFYELNRMVGGREVEAMFTPDGTLHSEEIEVGREKIPAAVHEALASRFGRATITKYEEIRDGSRAIVEYHVKLLEGGTKYKVVFDLQGTILGVYAEMPSEIEVPVK